MLKHKSAITGPKVKVGEEKEMSAIYGSEHLLRILGVFPFNFLST
jgi:mortality factor 4-like protein 1